MLDKTSLLLELPFQTAGEHCLCFFFGTCSSLSASVPKLSEGELSDWSDLCTHFLFPESLQIMHGFNLASSSLCFVCIIHSHNFILSQLSEPAAATVQCIQDLQEDWQWVAKGGWVLQFRMQPANELYNASKHNHLVIVLYSIWVSDHWWSPLVDEDFINYCHKVTSDRYSCSLW